MTPPSTITTDIWNDGRGNDVRDSPATQSLIVTAPGSVQNEVRDVLTQVKNLADRVAVDDLLPSLQGMASQGKTRHWELPNSAPKDSSQAASAYARAYLEKYFDANIAGISKHWGKPRYRGECRDTGFPNWSPDQKIATWPHGNGLAYVALRVADDGQLRMVVGWRKDS